MSDMPNDIVGVLRGEYIDCCCDAHGRCECGCSGCWWPEDATSEAADCIEKLQAENKRLRELVADKMTELDQEMGLQ